MAGPISIIFNM